MKDQLLNNIKLDSKLKRDGFVKLQFLSKKHLEAIAQLYEETRVEHEKVGKTQLFHATQDIGNPELTDYIDKKAKALLEPIIRKHFMNYRIIMANFIVKSPGPSSVLEPHQDWTFVDESKYGTFGFWTPVMETNELNGNLRFLPGSHKITPTLRVNYNYPCAFSKVKDLASEHMVDLTTQLGESVLLNHSVLHGSKPNLSNQSRVALTLGITHKDAQLLHYFSEDGKHVNVYHIDLATLRGLRYGIPPKKRFLIERKRVNFPIISKEQFMNWIKKQKPQYV